MWPFKKKIGLALSGGVSHGIAHVGVLKAIEKYKIPIHCVAGTSSGSIVGALYASGLELPVIEEIALKMNWHTMLRIHPFQSGHVTMEGLETMLRKYLGDKDFSQLKVPFAVATTCLRSAELCIIKSGKVSRAVLAATAFPGAFAPIEVDGHLVADGGIIGYEVPVDVCKVLGANFVIASEVSPVVPLKNISLDPLHVFDRALNIIMHNLALPQIRKANIMITPPIGEEDLWSMDEKKARRLIAAGEASALHVLRKFRRD